MSVLKREIWLEWLLNGKYPTKLWMFGDFEPITGCLYRNVLINKLFEILNLSLVQI